MSPRILLLRSASVVALLVFAPATGAAEPALTAAQTDFFEKHIRPLLIERCYQCHSNAKKTEGGLSLDWRGGWQKGGDRGPSIVPGKPDDSLLIQAVRHRDPNFQMPPKGKLSDAEIARLEEWIRMGAPDPRDAPPSGKGFDPIAAKKHWAYQPLSGARPPNVRDGAWPLGDIDRFILSMLESRGLRPSPDADRYTWLRRVSLDLTGLPPTPGEIEAFIADRSETAFESVVDRLLASPAFGERWARPWLDLVGYADQIGSANNVPAEHAWRYRDFVIRALNDDRPFDRFIREQLAGDLMTAGSIEERQDQLCATGFLVLGNVNIVENDKLVMRMDLVDQQVEKIGRTFLGLTLQCTRCHDHKFDPVTLRDYYGLAGIFASTDSTYKTERGVWSSVTKSELPETLDDFNGRQAALRDHNRQTAEIESQRTAADKRLAELEPLIAAAREKTGDPEGAKALAALEKERNELNGRKGSLVQRSRHLNYLRPAAPVAFAVKEATEIHDTRTQVRGNPHTLGDNVPRGFVAVASHGTIPTIPANQSGRLQLADWLTSAASPLTARVTVNRLWQRLFGQGLVASVDYFGLRGEQPSHPELLDWLSRRFVERGWSQKALIREIVLSRTYRQTSDAAEVANPQASEGALSSRGNLSVEKTMNPQSIDPENRLLWRMPPRRLDAEMLRDAVLTVSGGLQDLGGGPSLAPEFAENVGGLDPADVNPISFSLNRFREQQSRQRTIYLPVVRSSAQRGPADVLNFFDFAQPAQLVGTRPTTTVASQALFLLNGPILKEAASRLAAGVLSDSRLQSDDDRLGALTLRILNRPITPDELSAAKSFLAGETPGQPAWERLAQALLASNEFLFRL